MITLISGFVNGWISLCCNTTKNNPTPPAECDPYSDDPFAIANIDLTISTQNQQKDKNIKISKD